MSKHKVLIQIFPLIKDIDYLERTLLLLKQNSIYINRSKFHIILDVTLPTSDYLVDWDKSILKKDYFIDKLKHFENYGDCWDEYYFNIDNKVFGLLDHFNNTLNKYPDVDDVIILETDIIFNQHTLGYLLESSYVFKQTKTEYIITPEHTKLWDSSWDVIVNQNFINQPYNYRNIGDPLIDTILFTEDIELENLEHNGQRIFKFGGGWFTLYSKILLDNIHLPSTLKGYGALDNFITTYCYYTPSTIQVKVKNLIVTEDCKYTKTSLYNNYVTLIDRRNDTYQDNMDIMNEHFKTLFN